SSGVRPSSTKAGARACSSACSGVSVDGSVTVGVLIRVCAISSDVGSPGRERLLDAAVRLIAREGIDNVRIARIATEAGVSAGLVHYHFASRDALLEEAIEHSYERAGDMRLAPLGEGPADPAPPPPALVDH